MHNYHPLHLGDLEKSGLSPATIDQTGINGNASVPVAQFAKAIKALRAQMIMMRGGEKR